MLPCSQCEANREVELVSHLQWAIMHGIVIEYIFQSYRCEDCGCKFETAKMLDENLRRAREEYAKSV